MKRSYLLLLIVSLTACGFHLRGMVDMPSWLKNVAIITEDAHRDLLPLLKDQLQAYNIAVSATPAQADYWLIIEKDNYQQQITNIAASTAPRQYLLLYSLQFSLRTKQGKALISSAMVSVTRQLTVNNDRILGSNSEEALMASEMRRDAVMQVINRLSSK